MNARKVILPKVILMLRNEYTERTNYSCEEWIRRVASRGGTTEAAMASFRKRAVHEDIIAGAFAALHRAEELGRD